MARRDARIIKHDHDSSPRRPFWTPTFFEALIACVLLGAWIAGIIIVIRHEQAGFLLSIAYLLLALIGAAASWLLVWPLLRVIAHYTNHDRD